MSNFGDNTPTDENLPTRRFSEVPNNFKRRFANDRKSLLPRRYVLALMLFLLLLIHHWNELNVMYTLTNMIVLGQDAKVRYPSIGHWSYNEIDNIITGCQVMESLLKMAGALLIFVYSSHKFFLASIPVSSILHMLIPLALSHHSSSVLLLLFTQYLLAAPIHIAVLSLWKDWAPPGERTKLVLFSLSGLFIGDAAAPVFSFLFHYITTDESYYLSGIAGIIWSIFWYNISSDTPQNDPLISEKELLYLEGSIPTVVRQELRIRDIPWKSIITSKQVLMLCMIFFKMGISEATVILNLTVITTILGWRNDHLLVFIAFLSAHVILLPCSAILADWLIKRYSGRTLLIRKIFLSGGFFLQCAVLFGTLVELETIKAVFYMVAYLIFAISISGFITIGLDLSPRYVSIIAGIIFTFYNIGLICTLYFIHYVVDTFEINSVLWLFLFDGVISITAATLFAVWGDVEEQLWSLNFVSRDRRNDYRSYPKPEDEDDSSLVTENA